jgi:hypothetical protein
MISDELSRRGLEVLHILGSGSVRKHELNPSATVEDDHLVYRAQPEQGRLFGVKSP